MANSRIDKEQNSWENQQYTSDDVDRSVPSILKTSTEPKNCVTLEVLVVSASGTLLGNRYMGVGRICRGRDVRGQVLVARFHAMFAAQAESGPEREGRLLRRIAGFEGGSNVWP